MRSLSFIIHIIAFPSCLSSKKWAQSSLHIIYGPPIHPYNSPVSCIRLRENDRSKRPPSKLQSRMGMSPHSNTPTTTLQWLTCHMSLMTRTELTFQSALWGNQKLLFHIRAKWSQSSINPLKKTAFWRASRYAAWSSWGWKAALKNVIYKIKEPVVIPQLGFIYLFGTRCIIVHLLTLHLHFCCPFTSFGGILNLQIFTVCFSLIWSVNLATLIAHFMLDLL